MDVVREFVIDSALLLSPEKCSKAIEKLFFEWNSSLSRPTADFIQNHILAPSFRLIPNPKLTLKETDEKFLQLTEEQFHYLNFLEEQKQILIKGSAGTGKTLLLLEKARRLAEQGFSVLILCFNIKLSEYLKAATQNQPLIQAECFHGYCEFAAHKMNQPFVPPEDYGTAQVFYDEITPELLMTAIETDAIALFDAVLVDEGQDFIEAWWIPISSVVKKNGWFYIFYDPNQNIFGRSVNLPITTAPYTLTENCRNTVNISQWLCEINIAAAKPKKGLPSGEQPIIQHWKNHDEQIEQVKARLNQLLAKGFNLSDVVILTPHRKGKSILYDLTKQEKFAGLRIESIMRFKGLEAPIILVCDLGLDDCVTKRFDMLFTGASRAQQLLFVFCHWN